MVRLWCGLGNPQSTQGPGPLSIGRWLPEAGLFCVGYQQDERRAVPPRARPRTEQACGLPPCAQPCRHSHGLGADRQEGLGVQAEPLPGGGQETWGLSEKVEMKNYKLIVSKQSWGFRV